jgi:hypothetical protein
MVGKPGHAKAGGRQKGTPNKVTTSLREAIMHAFDTVGGEAYLVKVANKNPQVFCMLLARCLPVQVSGSGAVVPPAPRIAETLELLRSRLAALQYSQDHQSTYSVDSAKLTTN